MAHIRATIALCIRRPLRLVGLSSDSYVQTSQSDYDTIGYSDLLAADGTDWLPLPSASEHDSIGCDSAVTSSSTASLDALHVCMHVASAIVASWSAIAPTASDPDPGVADCRVASTVSMIVASLVLLANTDPRISASAASLLSACFTALRALSLPVSRVWAARTSTHLLVSCARLPPSHPIHSDVQGVLCRLFDCWMGLTKISSTAYVYSHASVLVDLRRDRRVYEVIQQGLRGTHKTALKYAQHLLKRIVFFSQSYDCSTDTAWPDLFSWPDLDPSPESSAHNAANPTTLSAVKQQGKQKKRPKGKPAAADSDGDGTSRTPATPSTAAPSAASVAAKMWEEYFVVFETIQEQYVHLLEPQLPKILALLRQRPTSSPSHPTLSLHESWWTVLLERGLRNQAHNIKKRMIEFVLSVRDSSLLAVMSRDSGFVTRVVLSEMDETALYSVPGLGVYVSPVGELVAEFVGSVATAYGDRAGDLEAYLMATVGVLATYTCRLAILFVLQGLASFGRSASAAGSRVRCLGNDQVRVMTHLLVGERALAIYKNLDTRHLIATYALDVLMTLSDTPSLDYRVIAQALVEFSRDTLWTHPLLPEHNRVRSWLLADYSNEASLRATVESEMRAFLASRGTDDETHDNTLSAADTDMAESITVMTLYTMSATDSLAERLSPLIDQLSRLDSPYQPPGVRHRTLRLLGTLLRSLRHNTTSHPTHSLCLSLSQFSQLLSFLESELMRGALAMSTQSLGVDAYVEILEGVLDHAGLPVYEAVGKISEWKSAAFASLGRIWQSGITDTSVTAVAYSHMQLSILALRIASQLGVPDLIQASDMDLASAIQRVDPLRLQPSGGTGTGTGTDRLNKPRQQLLSCRTSLVHAIHRLSHTSASNTRLTESFEWTVDALSSASYTTSPPLMHLAVHLLSVGGVDWVSSVADQVVAAMTHAVTLLEENWFTSKVWTSMLDDLASLAFHKTVLASATLMAPDSGWSMVLDTLNRWGSTRIGIMPVAATRLHAVWVQGMSDGPLRRAALDSMVANIDWVCRLLVYGPVRDQDAVETRHMAMISLKMTRPTLSATDEAGLRGTAAWNFHCKDYVVRVLANDLLLRLRTDDPDHVAIAQTVLHRLIGSQLRKKTVAQFINTVAHRRTVRTWIAIHILLHFVTDEQAAEVFESFVALIIREQLAESRVYIEWAIARLLATHVSLHEHFWVQLRNFEMRAHAISSLLAVALHVGPALSEADQPLYYRAMVQSFVPWATSHHFNMRVYAHYGLYAVQAACRSSSHLSEVLDGLDSLEPLLAFVATNADCAKHRRRIDDMYFGGGGFSLTTDLNVEFLFRRGLSHLDVADDERISAMAFVKIGGSDDVYSMPLGLDTVAASSTVPPHATTAVVAASETRETETPDDPQPGREDVYAQRKMLPWEVLLQSNIDLSERDSQSVRKRSPLILIASLVSKPPNLGGLCRTAEIFNASLLVVDNLAIRTDATFAAMAVSADKWMPMSQVRDHDLAAYLEACKADGYAVVGVEQASGSISLEQFVFPEKTVLLLGKEREGIPVELMHLLDHVLEIPQYGVIRSLNVHVSGALILWEYAKQRAAAAASSAASSS
ncbi:hypothetical protein BC831DRAFT_474711 [Entophlyctis helioformis]|nr:hypothetical protein BC831DRAFT_474711 [Entophlyctis helioformis]